MTIVQHFFFTLNDTCYLFKQWLILPRSFWTTQQSFMVSVFPPNLALSVKTYEYVCIIRELYIQYWTPWYSTSDRPPLLGLVIESNPLSPDGKNFWSTHINGLLSQLNTACLVVLSEEHCWKQVVKKWEGRRKMEMIKERGLSDEEWREVWGEDDERKENVTKARRGMKEGRREWGR